MAAESGWIETRSRWLPFIEWFERNAPRGKDGCPRIQIRHGELATALDCPERVLSRLIRRAEALGVLEVVRTTRSGTWGGPRAVNTYVLRVGLVEWFRDGDRIREAWFRANSAPAEVVRDRRRRASRGARPRARTPLEVEVEREVDDEFVRAMADAVAEQVDPDIAAWL